MVLVLILNYCPTLAVSDLWVVPKKVKSWITVGLGILSEHTALGYHWLVAGVDCTLLVLAFLEAT